MVRTCLAALIVMLGVVAFSPVVLAEQEAVALHRDKQYDVYTVVQGDTLWDVAAKKLSNPMLWSEIIVPKKFIPSDPDLLQPGQMLLLPLSQDGAEFVSGERQTQGQAE